MLQHHDADGSLIAEYPISSAANGIGFKEGSFATPTGRFQIAEMIGQGAEPFTIFKGRQPVGVHDPSIHDDADLITSRIIWLDGLDENNANTKERYIYIHGTNHEEQIGTPCSCGCIRMLNADIIELFDALPADASITINA